MVNSDLWEFPRSVQIGELEVYYCCILEYIENEYCPVRELDINAYYIMMETYYLVLAMLLWNHHQAWNKIYFHASPDKPNESTHHHPYWCRNTDMLFFL